MPWPMISWNMLLRVLVIDVRGFTITRHHRERVDVLFAERALDAGALTGGHLVEGGVLDHREVDRVVLMLAFLWKDLPVAVLTSELQEVAVSSRGSRAAVRVRPGLLCSWAMLALN